MFEAASAFTIQRRPMVERATKSKSISGDSVRLLSWNIAKTNHTSSWARDCRELIERFEPTLVFLQEVRLRSHDSEIAELNHMGWSFAPNFYNHLDGSYAGVLVAAQAQPVDANSILSPHFEPILNTPKVALMARYRLHGQAVAQDEAADLLTINVHAINFVDRAKFCAQLHAIEALLAEHCGAAILAGDFNTWSRGRWRVLRQMTTRLKMQMVSFAPADLLKVKRFLLSPPLDHIFYRGFEQKTGSARVIDTLSSSDHNPLLVELTM